jgi:LacI family transcriptional regulator, repressor for deo operon, udp, cdd, tsx, nupC, and nupG
VNGVALCAIHAAGRLGRAVPEEVSVVGYDDSRLIAFTDPPLTTVRQPVAAMSQAAVNALLEEIGGTPAPHSEFVFLPELVVRGSTGAAPGTPGTPATARRLPVRGEPDLPDPTGV